jgi:APA family basic amino acid/polyamine antiporter
MGIDTVTAEPRRSRRDEHVVAPAEPPNADRRAAKPIGLTSAAALVVASMVGAGVFTTSGLALQDLGERWAVLLAWGVGGLLAVCGALSYGAFAVRMPISGGEYTFLSRTVHPLAGFLAGWLSLLAGFTAPIAASALGLQAYLAESVGLTTRPQWIGTAAILGATLMHGLRVEAGLVLQNFVVAVKIVLIVGFVAAGIVLAPDLAPAAPHAEHVPLGAFAVTVVWVSFSYSGWNAAVYVASEVRDPERNLWRALVLATALVTMLYLALNAVFLYSTDPADLAGKIDVGAVAAEALGGPLLRRAVTALVALALFTSISSMVMAGPRVYARMAEDGLLPRVLVAGGDTPRAAVLVQAALAILVVWTSGLADLLSYIGFTLGLSSAATIAALVALRRREGPERVPIPGYPWVPATFIATTVLASAFLIWRESWQALLGLVTVGAGLPVYAWMRRTRRA